MAPRIFNVDPAFNCPLTPDELSMLGLIAVSWGQIEIMVDEIVSHAHAFDPKQRNEFLTDKPMGGKLVMLKKNIDRLPEHLHEQAKHFVAEVHEIKTDRNACFHGVWGWYAAKRTKKLIPAVWHHKKVKNPLKASDLERLAKKSMNCTWLGHQVMCDLLGWDTNPGKFTWSADGNYPPKWLEELFGPAQKGREPKDRKK